MKKRIFIVIFMLLLLLTGCTAVYKTVSFECMGETTKIEVEIRKKVEKPVDPEVEGYVFKGWFLGEEEFDFETKILKDITLVAKFEKTGEDTDTYYTVTFKDYDGTVLKEERVKEGLSAKAPESPRREGYSFSGWSDSFSNVRSDIIITATYVEIGVTTYKVTFVNYDGSILKEILVAEGEAATAPQNPARTGYEFKGWVEDFSNITEPLTVHPRFEINVYTVVFKDYDGRVIVSMEVEYGHKATPPASPKRDGYEFKGWDKSSNVVVSDLVITALYEVIRYTVTFKDYNGSILKTEEVVHGANATAPASPKRDGYIFKGWDKDFNNVTADLVINATYEEESVNNEYSITYNLGDGTFNALNKNEFVKLFLLDFYAFVDPTETKHDFMYGEDNSFKGAWENYLGGYFTSGVNKLLKDNDFTLDDENYFLNSKKYKDKWAPLANWIKDMNKRLGDGKAGDYYGGSIDLYRYCVSDTGGFDSVYGDMFNLYPNHLSPSLVKYEKSNTDIILEVPYREAFEGWYLKADFSGSVQTKIPANTTGSLTYYAKWKDENIETYEVSFNSDGGIKVDSITALAGSSITLPRTTKGGYLFDGWMVDGVKYAKNSLYTVTKSVVFKATYKNNLTNLVYSGSTVKYRNSSVAVEIPITYESKVSEFRGAWVTSLVGDFSPSTDKNTMMARLNEVLDLLESFNMNAVVFHIRIMNDACYKTDLAPIRYGYGNISTFENWDYLEWFISECHERGIEFHAWLNPYRISSNGYSDDVTCEEIASKYEDYPKNPASKAENILVSYRDSASRGAILNPCKEEVQDYIVDVCLEIMENYDIDAIHFDDYFYAQLSSNNSFLTEADQSDYEAYIDSHPEAHYSKTSSSNKQQWRRDNVDNFIYKLHTAMTEFNIEHKRGVQLGIAPTGIYKNGNGVVTYNSDGSVTTTGSNTSGQTHYSSYLFCDTVKWIRNEWIDYICPQSYWAFTHSTAGYADVVDWWDKIVEGTRVNLYTGMGIYMSTDYTSSKSWYSEEYEASNQVLYNTKFNNIKGTCIYVYNRIRRILNDDSLVAHNGLLRIKNEYWSTYVPAPTTMASKYKQD